MLHPEIDCDANGWFKVWVDFVTSDGLIYVYLGLVKRNIDSHVFRGAGESVLLGGVEVHPAFAV